MWRLWRLQRPARDSLHVRFAVETRDRRPAAGKRVPGEEVRVWGSEGRVWKACLLEVVAFHGPEEVQFSLNLCRPRQSCPPGPHLTGSRAGSDVVRMEAPDRRVQKDGCFSCCTRSPG